jgi:hypothetical protein
MKLFRVLLAAMVLTGLVGVALVSKDMDTSAGKMASAADRFLSSLSGEQKAKTVLAFDDKERTNWNFVPLQTRDRKPTRKGLPLEEMNDKQRAAARELLRAGLSARGFLQASAIMSLEAILRDLEKGGAMVRNPDWYFFTVFGEPSATGKWGWRVEGHHLALNFTLDKGKVIGATPAFFGANPATIMAGPRKGEQTLGEIEKLARDLYAALDDEQKKTALQPKQFEEIEQAKPAPRVGDPRGLPAARMTNDQKAILVKLVEAYAHRLPEDLAAAELAKVKEAGFDKVHFAIAGKPEAPGNPYTYRIQGPTFVVEFLNVQNDSARNPANHIHSAWRNLQGDFGLAATP